MTALPIIRLHDRSDLVTALIGRMGYYPHESVVLAGLADGRVTMVARVDMAAGSEHGVARTVAQAIKRSAPDSTQVIALYVTADRAKAAAFEVETMLCVLAVGLEYRDGITVVGDRYWCADDEVHSDGHPFAMSDDVLLQFAMAGAPQVVASREEQMAKVQPGTATIDPIPTDWIDLDQHVAADIWRRIITGEHVEDDLLSYAAAAVAADIHFRDAVVGKACASIPPDLFNDGYLEKVAAVPSFTDVDWGEVHRVLPEVAARIPAAPNSEAVLCVLASLLYGDGAVCKALLQRALDIDPKYRLALLTMKMQEFGINPIGSAR